MVVWKLKTALPMEETGGDRRRQAKHGNDCQAARSAQGMIILR